MPYYHGLKVICDSKRSPDLGGSDVHVALWLCGQIYADERGPQPLKRSIPEIASGARLSERTVQRAVRRLVALGYIEQHVVRLEGQAAKPSIWTPGRRLLGEGGGDTVTPPMVSESQGGGDTVAPLKRKAKNRPKPDPSSYPPTASGRRSAARPTGARAPQTDEPKKVGEIVGMLPWLLDRAKREEP